MHQSILHTNTHTGTNMPHTHTHAHAHAHTYTRTHYLAQKLDISTVIIFINRITAAGNTLHSHLTSKKDKTCTTQCSTPGRHALCLNHDVVQPYRGHWAATTKPYYKLKQ